jgi:RHS repeat-associated protein
MIHLAFVASSNRFIKRRITSARIRRLAALVLIHTMLAPLSLSAGPPVSVDMSLTNERVENSSNSTNDLHASPSDTVKQLSTGQQDSHGMPRFNRKPPLFAPAPALSKADREVKVARIEIKPQDDIVLQAEQPIVLAAIPVDKDDNAIQGLAAEWESSDESVVKISKGGHAVAVNPGRARLTASVGNRTEALKVTVVSSAGKFGGRKPDSVRAVSGIRKDSRETVLASRFRAAQQRDLAQRSHKPSTITSPLPLRSPEQDPLPDEETGSLYQPSNTVGSPPGRTTPGAQTPPAAVDGTEMPGSNNFTFNVPIISLPGRGMDVSLGLVYNSLLWNRSTTLLGNHARLTYDVDSGWPAPGWRLGYGQMESQGNSGFTLTDSSGTRHRLIKVDPSNPNDYNYETTDGTFIRFNGGLGWGTVTYTDGTRVQYGATGNGGQPSGPRSYPVKITDSSGNYIQITYVNNQGPQISSVQDTLGRYVQFNYSSNDLVSITAPGYASQADREVIRFYYEDITVSTDFQGFCAACIRGGGSTRVLRYVYVPGDTANTGRGYRYDYSAYGMIYNISQRREMKVDATTKALTDYGVEAASTAYNYPVTASGLTDAPAFTTRTDDWAGRTSAQSIYTFSNNAAQGTTSVTAPDGTVTETKIYMGLEEPLTWKNGMLKEMTVKKANGTVLAHTLIDWEDGGAGNNPRLTLIEVTNDAGETKATTYDYTGMSYNNVGKVIEHDFAPAGTLGAELRRTETTYEDGVNWTNRRLVHLPKIVRVYDGSTVISRVDYTYDGDTLANLPTTVATQDQVYNPNSASYDATTAYRGNVTSVTSYADAATASNPITNTMKYDITGNVVEATASCCRRKTFTYSPDYQYAYPTAETQGDVNQMTVSTAYDFNTGLVRTTTDENLQTSTVHYFPQSLRYYMTVYPDSGYSAIDYNDGLFGDPDASHLHSLTMRTVGTGVGTAVHSYDFYDGRGAAVRHFEDYTAAAGGNATTDVEYDVMGRVKRVSNPYYATNGTLTPINPTDWWTTNVYDELGRVKQVTLADGSIAQSLYAGTVMTVTDQAGKQRRQKMDALGRVVRVDEPDSSGQLGDVLSPAQPTAYEYDKLDNLIHIQQTGNNATQHRYFKYDSLSRLTHERQVEQAAPYTTTDYVAGNNQWSKKIIYDSQGLVTDAYDARQVRTQLSYDGLNRVIGVTYTGETSPNQTPAVTYTYDQQHTNYYNKGRLTEVKTAATANAPVTIQAYDYDKMGRVKSHNQTVGSNGYPTSYNYNIAGWLTSQTYPSGKVVSYGYDEAARLSNVKDTTNQQAVKTYVNNLSYAPHGGMLAATLGNGAVETVGYNNRLQPINLSLTKDNTILQKYEYKYGQVNQTTGTVDETKNNGQIARVEGYIGTSRQWQQRFGYDSLGRLETAGEYRGDTLAQTYQSNFSYDRFGNRYQKQLQNSQSLPFTAIEDTDISKTTNRLTSSTTYDDAGNVTTDQKFRGKQYGYDANGRMWWSANVDNTGEATAVYDALGQRVRTTAYGNTKTLVYDVFGRMIAEYDSQPQAGTGGTKYLMSDLQGSARLVTDNTGSVIARRDYQPFGSEIGANVGLRTTNQKYDVSDSNRQRYALTERDATGLEHTWWRKYDSSSGRWTTPDPYTGSMSVGDPQSFNRYSYVKNDPVNLVDPTGLMCYARYEVWSVNGRESWTFLGVWCEPNDNTPASPQQNPIPPDPRRVEREMRERRLKQIDENIRRRKEARQKYNDCVRPHREELARQLESINRKYDDITPKTAALTSFVGGLVGTPLGGILSGLVATYLSERSRKLDIGEAESAASRKMINDCGLSEFDPRYGYPR